MYSNYIHNRGATIAKDLFFMYMDEFYNNMIYFVMYIIIVILFIFATCDIKLFVIYTLLVATI